MTDMPHCYRCKKEFLIDRRTPGIATWKVNLLSLTTPTHEKVDLELCDACVGDFWKWMRAVEVQS